VLYDSDVVDACLKIYKAEGKKAFLPEENSLSAAKPSSAVEM
jgi:hypothetical protein